MALIRHLNRMKMVPIHLKLFYYFALQDPNANYQSNCSSNSIRQQSVYIFLVFFLDFDVCLVIIRITFLKCKIKLKKIEVKNVKVKSY
jgi:hypothetical protein